MRERPLLSGGVGKNHRKSQANRLHLGCQVGATLTAAEALIEAGIEVNKAGDLGYSPLHVACVQGNTEMVKRRWLVRHQQSASKSKSCACTWPAAIARIEIGEVRLSLGKEVTSFPRRAMERQRAPVLQSAAYAGDRYELCAAGGAGGQRTAQPHWVSGSAAGNGN